MHKTREVQRNISAESYYEITREYSGQEVAGSRKKPLTLFQEKVQWLL